MPIKIVELDTWLDGWGGRGVAESFGSASRDAQLAPAESGHLMGLFMEALTNVSALAPLMEDLTAWTAASDHLQTCAICRAGVAALAAVGDTPEGALGALLAHAVQDYAKDYYASITTKPRRASTSRARARKQSTRYTPLVAPVPGASSLASYVAIVQASGVATAMTQLPDVARHLLGCPRCRRDVTEALAALAALAALRSLECSAG